MNKEMLEALSNPEKLATMILKGTDFGVNEYELVEAAARTGNVASLEILLSEYPECGRIFRWGYAREEGEIYPFCPERMNLVKFIKEIPEKSRRVLMRFSGFMEEHDLDDVKEREKR